MRLKKITWNEWLLAIDCVADQVADTIPCGHVRKAEKETARLLADLINNQPEYTGNVLDGEGVVYLESKNLGNKRFPDVYHAVSYCYTSGKNNPYHETEKMIVSKYGRIRKEDILAVVFEEE